MTILDDIAAQRVLDVAEAKQHVSEAFLHEKIQNREKQYGPPLDVIERLHAPAPSGWSSMALAAEFKRASPSKGDIAVDTDIEEQAQLYASAGASMISVLTEPKWFKGSLEDMAKVSNTVITRVNRPAVLRKDFIIDEYQLLEARAYGADCILLIVAILNPTTLNTLMKTTLALGMTPLVEVNNEEELAIALEANARLIGVNNRNLRTFKLDLETTGRISKEIQSRGLSIDRHGITLMALSGIHSNADVIKFQQCGARGVLVGESLMKSNDTKTMIHRLMGSQEQMVSSMNTTVPLAKICGITTVEDAMTALRHGANLIGIILVEHSPRCVDIPQAQAIVQAVRSYGERTGRILDEYLKAEDTYASKTTAEWFQRNAMILRQACHRAPLVVGVVANQSVETMNELAETIGLDLLQLHGDEGFTICQEVKIPTIRVFHLPDHLTSESVNAEAIIQHMEAKCAEFLLLDTTVKGQKGGTGSTFDWRIAAVLNQTACVPCFMAGGLTPENVAKAITIANPLGVDVSSGVEKGKGIKDHQKVQAFLRVVQTFNTLNQATIEEEEVDN